MQHTTNCKRNTLSKSIIVFWVALSLLTFVNFVNSYGQVSVGESQKIDKSDKITYLALGDSYTVAAAETKANSYPYQLTESLRKKSVNIDTPTLVAGIGWTTQDLLNNLKRLSPDKKYTFVTVLIGVNNQFQRMSPDSYRQDFDKILEYAVNLCSGGARQVYVLSIPDWSVTPFGQIRGVERISTEIANFNKINKEESLTAQVNYINITDVSIDALDDKSLTANDGLHPSGKLYSKWVKKLLPKIISNLK